jgi:fibronectin-binding autotransporter adhesin
MLQTGGTKRGVQLPLILLALSSHSSAKSRVLLCATALLVVGWLTVTGHAASGTWAVNADGNWSDTTNWSGGTVADGVDATASFTNNITGPRTVTLDNDFAIGNLVFSDNVSSFASAWTLTGSKTLMLDVTSGSPAITTTFPTTINTVLAGNDGFTKFGSKSLSLTAVDTYGGTTTISRGTLMAVDGVGLPATTNLNLNNGGSYQEMGGVFSRALGTGAGQVQWTGDGGFSALTGSMTVRLDGGTSAVTWGGGSFVPTGQSLFLEGQVDFQNDINLAAIDRTVRVGIYGPTQISGSITNGNLVKVSNEPHVVSAPLILTGNNTYGNTTFGIGDIAAGNLQIGNGGTTGTLGTGTVSFDYGDLVFNRSNAMTVANTISGPFRAGIVQKGSGTTTLSGNLSGYAGTVEITDGTLVFDYGTFDSSKMGDGSPLYLYSGNLQLAGGTHQEIVGQTNVDGPATISRLSGAATVRLKGIFFAYGGSLDITEDNLADTGNRNVNGALPGITVNGWLAKNATDTNNGRIVALADADYVDVPRLGGAIGSGLANVRIVDGGTVGPVAMPGAGTTTVNSITQSATNGTVDITLGVGKTLRLGSYGTILVPLGASALNITGGTLTAGGTENRDGTIAIQNVADVTIGSVISDCIGVPWGPVMLAKQGAGRLVLTGANIYTRATYITGGTLQIGAGGTTGSVSTNIDNDGSLSFNRSDGITFGGVVSGAGALSQDGTGTLTLTNANTYMGGTTVNAGTLFVNNVSGSGTGTGPVAVIHNALVGGTGTIAGAVTNNGTVAPGSSVGTLRINSNYTQSADGSLQVEFASGSSFDRLVVDGTAALDGTLRVVLFGGYLPQDGTQFDFLDWGSRMGSFATVELPVLPSGLSWDTSQLNSTGTLGVAGLAGDFDVNGTVDAADYGTWRKNGGTQAEYNLWRANFGRILASGASLAETAAVPEPSSLALLFVVAFILLVASDRAKQKPSYHSEWA